MTRVVTSLSNFNIKERKAKYLGAVGSKQHTQNLFVYNYDELMFNVFLQLTEFKSINSMKIPYF